MKKYYYGSSNPNLNGLKTNMNPSGKIYMTINKTYALIYATYKYINLFIDSEDGKIKFLNIYPNLFEKLYGNTIGYIYSVELDESEFYSDAKEGIKTIADSYFTTKDVSFEAKEEVNVFEEFMKLSEKGLFEIVEKDEIPEDYILDLKRYYTNKYKHSDMSSEEIEYFDKFLPDLISHD